MILSCPKIQKIIHLKGLIKDLSSQTLFTSMVSFFTELIEKLYIALLFGKT